MNTVAERALETAQQVLPTKIRETLFVRAFAMAKIPMLAYVRPVVEELSDTRCVVRLPLSRRTKNHLNSMYFGALSTGADVAGGLIAMKRIRERGNKVNLVFKDFHADFLSRAEGDVVFACEEGEAIGRLVDKALETGDRVEMPVHVVATVPQKSERPVAKFTLTLSLKRRR